MACEFIGRDGLSVNGEQQVANLYACNPPLAHEALQAVPDIGLLLPCNVIVREEAPGRVVVGFLDPQVMVHLVRKPGVKTIADAAEQRLRRVCENLGGGPILAT